MRISEFENARPALVSAALLLSLGSRRSGRRAGPGGHADAIDRRLIFSDGGGVAPPASTLAEVVVAAQRRTEPIQNVPMTINYLSGTQLANAGVASLGDIASLTPGLRFDYSGAFAYPTIRGVGTTLADAGSGTNVGIDVDGFYQPTPRPPTFSC